MFLDVLRYFNAVLWRSMCGFGPLFSGVLRRILQIQVNPAAKLGSQTRRDMKTRECSVAQSTKASVRAIHMDHHLSIYI